MSSPSTFSHSENFFGQSSLLLSIFFYLLRTSCRRSQTKLPRSEDWCKRRDLNPHVFRHWILSPARLPIPPLLHIFERKSFVFSYLQPYSAPMELRRAYFLSLLLAVPYEALAKYGGLPWNRTKNPQIKSLLLCQLSQQPISKNLPITVPEK